MSGAEVGAWVSESLADHHRLDTFECGQADLERWLKQSAAHAQAMRTARTFVWHGGDRHIVAYFSLAAHLVQKSGLPKHLARGAPDAIPAVMLARLALHRSLHGQGLGGELLWDALSRAVAASEIAGARMVVVDAIDASVAGFYAHHGFAPVPGQPLRLVQKIGDVAAALQRGSGRRT